MIPNTITDFLQCLADARNNVHNHTGSTLVDKGYYIKLTSDIDCADDLNYIGYTTRLDFGSGSTPSAVVKVYSDNNSSIRGLTVKDQYFYTPLGKSSTEQTVIENINFLDCFFKPTTANCSMTSNTMGYFNGCKLSFSVYSYSGTCPTWSYRTSTIKGGTLRNCSLYFKVNDGSIAGSLTSPGIFYQPELNVGINSQNNIIIIDGLTLSSNQSNGNCLITFDSGTYNNNYNSIILKNCKFKQSATNLTYHLLRSGSYNYVAVINPIIDETITSPISISYYNTQYSILAAPQESYGTTQGKIVMPTPAPSSQVISYATLDQLKDVDYLLSIGFVP